MPRRCRPGYGFPVLAAQPLWERMIILAPALVIGVGLVAAVLILLGRAFVDSVRESGHQRLIYAGLGVLAVCIVVLTYLGVELPREGG
jgi:ABC-type anion transport system duplicated permease subunit